MKFIVVAYYTFGTIYEDEVSRLIASLNKFHLLYDVCGVPNLGTWHKNVNYKPTFIRQMMDKHPDCSIAYVDCDAEFRGFPYLFSYGDLWPYSMAAFEFDRQKYYGGKAKGKELLSGTLFFNNTPDSKDIVDKWQKMCAVRIGDFDQRSLQAVVGSYYQKLPPEYCTIFDTMSSVEEPIIVHYQASRKVRNNKMRITK